MATRAAQLSETVENLSKSLAEVSARTEVYEKGSASQQADIVELRSNVTQLQAAFLDLRSSMNSNFDRLSRLIEEGLSQRASSSSSASAPDFYTPYPSKPEVPPTSSLSSPIPPLELERSERVEKTKSQVKEEREVVSPAQSNQPEYEKEYGDQYIDQEEEEDKEVVVAQQKAVKIKVEGEIPAFSGENVVEYEGKVRLLRQANPDVDEKRFIRLLRTRLSGKAVRWAAERPEPTELKSFLSEVRAEFSKKGQLAGSIMSLKQGDMPLRKFEEAFKSLSEEMAQGLPEKFLTEVFLNNMSEDAKRLAAPFWVENQNISIAQMVDRVERLQSLQPKTLPTEADKKIAAVVSSSTRGPAFASSRFSSDRERGGDFRGRGGYRGRGRSSSGRPICQNCGKSGHTASHCYQLHVGPDARCSACGGVGHQEAVCPSKRNRANAFSASSSAASSASNAKMQAFGGPQMPKN
jgi:hypothetical protein